MVLAPLPIFNSSSFLINLLVIIPSSQIIISFSVTFMFHNLFSSLASAYISFCFLWFFTLWSASTAKSVAQLVIFYVFCWLSLGLMFWPELENLSISQNIENFMRLILYHRTNVLCCKERSPQKRKYSNSKVREKYSRRFYSAMIAVIRKVHFCSLPLGDDGMCVWELVVWHTLVTVDQSQQTGVWRVGPLNL